MSICCGSAVSGQRNDSAGLILGHLSLARDLVFAGRFSPSRSHLEEGLALYDPISHLALVRQAAVYPQIVLREQLAFALFCLGYPRQASAQSDAALAEARSLAHLPSLALSLEFGTRLLSLDGETVALKERVEQLSRPSKASLTGVLWEPLSRLDQGQRW
jgi:hypothetical protein